MNPELVTSDIADPNARRWILEGLAAANRAHVQDPNLKPLLVAIRHPGDGVMLGGLWGRTSWDWLLIELLYVPPDMRGMGWGKRLVEAAEREAVQRHCNAAWVDSYSFQAPGFYERLGYSVFGKLDDYPAGHQRFFLSRQLSNPSDSSTDRS